MINEVIPHAKGQISSPAWPAIIIMKKKKKKITVPKKNKPKIKELINDLKRKA